ncbi:pilus assembly protein PilP [Massilia agilis]|uniref:Pilus assembly protein PilP n=1 Tax=Massilia agilis TaxID=1811226 RepID=A0ABT2DEX8_9BURK|nr:pilus assembly protein PilP [Massilia agilis]MCS0809389.1 pilus assembly protein PilP [Massilia agilis]
MSRKLVLACALLLSGCGDSDVREVRDWMAQVQKDTKPSVKPLSPPKEFVPFAYNARDAVDPFSAQKLLVELAKAAETSNNPNRPDMNRPKELLESYPLDTMKMVGSLQKSGIVYALLQIDKNVYQVKSGMRVGQNFGLVTRVTENAIDIREVVQDAGGDWVERMARLELQESK